MDTVWRIAPGILNWGAVGFFDNLFFIRCYDLYPNACLAFWGCMIDAWLGHEERSG